jgi:hypothetical protein
MRTGCDSQNPDALCALLIVARRAYSPVCTVRIIAGRCVCIGSGTVGHHPVKDLLGSVKTIAQEYYALTGRPLGVTAEIAEYEAALLLGIELAPVRQPGYDAIRETAYGRTLLQIKGRRIPAGANRVSALDASISKVSGTQSSWSCSTKPSRRRRFMRLDVRRSPGRSRPLAHAPATGGSSGSISSRGSATWYGVEPGQ